MFKGEKGPVSPLYEVPLEVNQWIQNRVGKFYLDWSSQNNEQEMAPWKDFAPFKRAEIIAEVMSNPQVKEFVGDPSLDLPDRQVRGEKVIEAIDYEIKTGVIDKFD